MNAPWGTVGRWVTVTGIAKDLLGWKLVYVFAAVLVFVVVFFSTYSKTGQRSQSYTLTTMTSHVSSRFVTISEIIWLKNFP